MVAGLRQELTDADFLIFFSFDKIKTAEITRFRKTVKKSGGQFRIAKNTLLGLAMDQSGLTECREMMQGPTGFISLAGNSEAGDEIDLVRKTVEFSRDKKGLFLIRGGSQGKTLVSPEQIDEIARVPGRAYLLARFCGNVVSPITGFLFTLKAVPQKFVLVLKQLSERENA